MFCIFFLYACPFFCLNETNAQQTPLNEVLDLVESKHKVSFIYDYDLISQIPVYKKINLDLPLEELCTQLFYGYPVRYERSGKKNIRLIPQQNLSPQDRMAQVLDVESGKPVSFVAISFDNGSGTESNEEGIFVFDPKKTDTLRLYRLGYQQISIPVSEALYRPISMKITPEAIEGVEVIEEEPGIIANVETGRLQINQYQLSKNNASVFTLDPLRSVQLLPGIQAFNDLSSDIQIRGGDAGESLIVLDGITLYEAKHYYGIFSAINASVVNDIGVYKNQTPPELEGRTSGVVDISTFPVTEKHEGFLDASIGLMNASIGTVFPIGNAVQLMGAFRSTTGNPGQSNFQDLLNPRPLERLEDRNNTTNVISQTPEYSFYDWNIKARVDLSPNVNLSLTTFHSEDKTNLNYDRELKISRPFTDIVLYEEGYAEEGSWENHAYQVNLQTQLSERVNWTNRACLSESTSSSALESEVFRRLSIDSTITGRYSNRIENNIADFHFFSTVSISPKQTDTEIFEDFKGGVDVQRINNQFDIDYGDEKQFQRDRSVNVTSAFLSQKMQITDQWQLEMTGRTSHYSQTSKLYFFPQVATTVRSGSGGAIKAAYSSPTQFLQRAYYEDLTGRTYSFWISANDDQVPVSRSHKYMIGYQKVSDYFKWDVEVFHKKTNGIIELASNQLGFDPRTFTINTNTKIRIYNGDQRTTGVDVMGVYEKEKYQLQLAYTLSKTDSRFREIFQNQWFPSRDDRRHQLKLTQTLALKNWSFQAVWVYASGRPFTDISKVLGVPRNRVEIDPNLLQTRLKDYHRLDLGVTLQIEGESFDSFLSASIINVFNRRNVQYAQFIFGQKSNSGNIENTVAGTEWGLLDRTLNLTAGLRF